jgi:hypothetical protein
MVNDFTGAKKFESKKYLPGYAPVRKQGFAGDTQG